MKLLKLVFLSLAVTLFASCGGGGGGSATVPVVGYVVDAPVEGLAYSCGGLSGTTGSDGSFSYDAGSACTFKIGNVTIGAFNAAPTDGVVTPHDLAGVSRDDSLNSSAVAIAQFLQSLDDGSGSGKIKIPASVATALSVVPAQKIVDTKPLSQNQLSALVSTATSNTKTLVPASTAAAAMNTFIQTAYPNLDISKGAVAPTTPSNTTTTNAPALTSSIPATLTATSTSTGFTVTTNIDAKGYYVVLPANSKAPNKWQVISGADASNKAASLSGSISMSGGAAASKLITGLEFDTAYRVYFVASNARMPSKVSDVVSSSVTTAPEPKAPVLSGAFPTSLTQTDHSTSFAVTTDVTGAGYWVVLPSSSSAPDAAQIIAGKDAAGKASSLAGAGSLVGGAMKVFSIAGMDYEIGYKLYFVAVNGSDITKITSVFSSAIGAEHNVIDPQGFWNGTTTSTVGNTVSAVVLDSGEIWGIYSSGATVTGALYGTTTVSGTTATVNGINYNFVTSTGLQGALAGPISAKSSMSLSTSGGSITYSLTYSTTYETPATSTAVAGTWAYVGRSSSYSLSPSNITIDNSGNFTLSQINCASSGNIVPRSGGKNVYNITLTSVGIGCAAGQSTLTGIAYLDTSVTPNKLHALTLTSRKNDGLIVIGTKQ